MPISRRALLTEGSRAVAVAGTAAIGIFGAQAARPVPTEPLPPKFDESITAPVADGDFLFVPESHRIVAFSRRCTHLGCHLNINTEESGFACPCHGSEFNLSGERVSGPATRNLAILASHSR